MSKTRQTGNKKPVRQTPPPPPPPSIDRLLIGIEQRSDNHEIARKVIKEPEKK